MELSRTEIIQISIMFTIGFISLLSSLSVIFTILKKNLYKSLAFKILLYISINDSIRSLIGFLPPELIYNSYLCDLIGFLSYAVFVSNIIWGCSLSYTIYQIVVLENSEFEKFHKYWFIFAYFVPFGINLLPFITSSYGYGDHVCELKEDFDGNIWRFLVFYVPATSLFAVSGVLFYKTYKKIKLMRSDAMKTVIFERGFVYPVSIALVTIPYGLIRVVHFFLKSEILNLVALIFYLICVMHGCVNAFIFFSNRTVKEVIKNKNKHIYASMGIAAEDECTLKISFRSTLSNSEYNKFK